jgi:hypothetical protein
MFSSNTTQTSGGYEIQRSLRFNSADTTYLNRTPASAGNRKTWTWSGWVKRSSLNAFQYFFNASPDSFANTFSIASFGAGASEDKLRFQEYQGGAEVCNLRTTQVFRDVSAWYHILLVADTTQATDTNRFKMYVNGSQITSFSTATYPAQNTDLTINNNVLTTIAYTTTANNFNGYMTEVNFIDGQALTPSSFGEYNADTGVWQPKRYGGSYGTNGFYLNFSNNSNTTAATLGADYSGNGNNWTPNNFSVSAGAGNDSLVDVPTNWGVDTGVGGTVRGNYCTLNPLNAGSTATLSNGNLDMAGTSTAATSIAYSTIGVSTGKWYWEVVGTSGGAFMIGIGGDGGRFDWQTTRGYGYAFNGQKYTNSVGTAYGATYTNNDVIGVALDMDAGTLTFYKNGVSQGTAFSGLTGTWFPAAQNPGAALTETYNFGQRPFAYTAPSGFKALNTQNLPTPTIGATPATQAGKFFNPVLYTGTGSSLSVTGVGFQPDWTWIKERNAAADHGLYDVVRGVQNQLESNTTDAETTETTGLTAFGSDGFTVGALAQLNTSADTYVAWNWKANGAGVTNTAGSITSTVSANTTSGFSVVTYTNASSGTVGHGLGAAPVMVIYKDRVTAGNNWVVLHQSLADMTGSYLTLNTTNAVATGLGLSAAPTSTVISTSTALGGSGNGFVAYCFSEVPGYSKFGSYTGNGSTDGPFVYTGFRPAYVMLKMSSATSDWWVYDVQRSAFNVTNTVLYPNGSFAEGTGASIAIDILSNGFKIRSDNGTFNGNNNNYIFAAFASAPQKFALAR